MIDLVSYLQIAGVEDKSILENVLIVNKLHGSRIKSGNPGLVQKFEFAEAFDHVS